MIKIIDTLDRIRNCINNEFYSFLDKNEEELDYDEIFGKIEMISTNPKWYRVFCTILFLDDYRLKLRYYVNNQATDEEIEKINFYENNINSVDDIVNYMDDDADVIDMLNSTLVFNKLKSNYQREVLNSSMVRNNYLKSVTPLHILDVLYYSFPISLDNFLELYNEYNEEENSLDASSEATLEFSKMLTDIYVSDIYNYKELIDGLVETYNIMKFHKVFEDQELDQLVKKNSLDIYNEMYFNAHIRLKMLNYYLEYNVLCSEEEIFNFKEEYKKMVKNKN